MVSRTDLRQHQHQSFTSASQSSAPAGGRSFLLHCVAAMFGGGFCAAFAGVLLARFTGLDSASSNSNLVMWYSPLIWWAGLLLGFILNRRARSSVACYTWLAGALVLAFLATDLYWATRSWSHVRADVFPLWRSEHSPEDELGLLQLFFVWPAINSFAYALGASIPLLFGRSTQHEHSGHERCR